MTRCAKSAKVFGVWGGGGEVYGLGSRCMSYPRRKVMKALADRGYVVLREGGKHTIVGKPGDRGEPVPRHDEINRITMRRIAKNLGIEWKPFEDEIR